jgi:hypothetical protein
MFGYIKKLLERIKAKYLSRMSTPAKVLVAPSLDVAELIQYLKDSRELKRKNENSPRITR